MGGKTPSVWLISSTGGQPTGQKPKKAWSEMRYDYFCFWADPSPQFFTEQLAIFFVPPPSTPFKLQVPAITGIGTYVAPILALSIHGSPKERNARQYPRRSFAGRKHKH
jgi:hypothetical protein